MLKLYHYSHKDFKGFIDPAFFGSNSFTGLSRRLSEVKRIYFYGDLKSREAFFNGAKYLYKADIADKYIYDLKTDILKCIGKFNDVTDFILFLKRKGYKGNKDFDGQHKIICIWDKVKIKECTDLANG